MDNIQITKEIRTAIKQGNTEKAIKLIGSDKELLNVTTPFGTWLHVAASHGKYEIVKRLVELGIDINRKAGVFEGSALNEAASEGYTEIVDYLLSHGAEMDVSEPERNPLFSAIYGGHIDIVKLLIKKGINISVEYSGENMKNMNALDFAYERGQNEIVQLLESKNTKSNNAIKEKNNIIFNQHDEILNHVTQYLGSANNTISEIIPGSKVAVDIHVIPPSNGNEFITFVTTGMSDCPMYTSKENDKYKYAELLIKLPLNWSINKNDMNDKKNYWPIEWLRKTAHIPHIYNGLLNEGVILPNGEPPLPFAENTKLSCVLVCKPKEIGLQRYLSHKGRIINFYTLVPIYKEEMSLALKNGQNFLLQKMKNRGISDIVDINRENVGL